MADDPIPLRPVWPAEQPRCNALLRQHHYLGFRNFRGHRQRLFPIVNNARFLLLPGAAGTPHLASHVLCPSLRRLPRDWLARHGHALLLAETFVDPERFAGTCYRAANWLEVGAHGFGRACGGALG